MAYVTKEDLLKRIEARPVEAVEDVPGWGAGCYLRRLSGGDRDFWDLWQISNSWSQDDQDAGRGQAGMLKPGIREARATLVALALCDQEGKRLFSDGEIPLVAEFDGEALDFLYDEVRNRNGLSRQAQEALAKNSESASDDSGSDSPES